MVKSSQPQQKAIPRAHTQDEMELAFRRLRAVKEHLDLLPDDDDPLAVFGDVIAELLEKRQIVADEISYKQQWLAEHTRR